MGNLVGGETWNTGADLVVWKSDASRFRSDGKYARWRHPADSWEKLWAQERGKGADISSP